MEERIFETADTLSEAASLSAGQDALRQALDTDLRDSLPQITLILGIFFLTLTVGHIVILTGSLGLVMAIVAALTAAVNAALSWALRRYALPSRWAHPLAAGLATLVLINALLHLYLSADPLQTTNVILLVIGAGLILFSMPWWLLVVGLTCAGWGIFAFLAAPDPAWRHFGFAMLSAVMISFIANLARLRTYQRLEDLRLQDQVRRVRLQEALHSTGQIQRALETAVDVGQRIALILDLELLLSQVVDLIRGSYGYYYVGIFLLDENNEYVVSRAGTGKAGRLLCEQGFRLRAGEEGVVGWVAQTDRVFNVRDVTREPRYMSVEALPDTRSELVLPLEVAGEILGVLDIQSEKVSAFDEVDIRILESLAGQVAVAIQNAYQYQAERKRRLFAEKLQDVGRALSRMMPLSEVLGLILEQLDEIVAFDRGSVMLESDDKMVIRASRGFPEAAAPLDIRVNNKPGDVFDTIQTTQRPLLLPDVQERADWHYVEDLPPARSWLGVPLLIEDQVIGMLSLTRERSNPFTNEDATLASAFASQAAVALENAKLYDDLNFVNAQLELTVEQLKQRSDDLRITYMQLARLDRTKSDFIAVASHELRTPLTVLSGYSQILVDDPMIKSDEYHRQLVAGIQAGTERLHTIVDSMLDVAKIDTRALQLHPEPFSLNLLIQGISRQLSDTLVQRDLLLTLEGLEALPMIQADIDALRKVFYHLIVNAIKYTPNGGTITVTGSSLPHDDKRLPSGGVEIAIRDTGIGIDPNVQQLIFAKFYQTGEVALHSTGSTKFKGGGPGLGLAVAQGIVEAHGGKIWVESPGYDEVKCPGSTFFVLLPLNTRSLFAEATLVDDAIL